MQLNKIGFTDIDGQFRGKYFDSKHISGQTDIKFCDVIFGWDINDDCYDNESVTGWGKGFPDGILSIYDDTKITMPWDDSTTLKIADFNNDELLKNVCPRSLLRGLQVKFNAIGLFPSVGFEYEWYNFKKKDSIMTELDSLPITNGMNGYSTLELSYHHDFIKNLMEQLLAIKIPIVGFHKETGPGVFEAAIKNESMVKAADYATLFKYAVKAVSFKHDIIASFMARWSVNLPGSGGHIHISILDEKDKDLFNFCETQTDGLTSNFLAGLIIGLPVLMPLMAPYINSYKRYGKKNWTPTEISWGYDNRTTAIRVKKGVNGNQHLEIRIPGADANPYLATYAILSAGMYGINNKLKLDSPLNNNDFFKKQEALPHTLHDAVTKMETSKIVKKMINPKFAEHFILTRKNELEKFNKIVHDWEIKRYLKNV